MCLMLQNAVHFISSLPVLERVCFQRQNDCKLILTIGGWWEGHTAKDGSVIRS